MKKILLPLILLFTFIIAHSQSGTITNIQVTQRTDGSGLIDVYFDLNGEANAYNTLVEVSFDGGDNYTPVPGDFLEGDTGPVSPGEEHQITWNGHESFPNTYSTKAQLRIIAVATVSGGNGLTGQPCPGMPTFTDPRDGNVYNTVQIGNQCWLKENLKYLPKVFPSSVGTRTDPHYYVNGYQGSNVSEAKATDNYQNYGVLYNWSAAMNGQGSSSSNPSGVQGVCPAGWHLPSDAEWSELTDYVVAQGYPNEYDNLNGAGNALKSCRQVDSPLGGECATIEHPRWNSHTTHYGTDQFSFSAQPGGFLHAFGYFTGVSVYGDWQSSTENSSIYASNRQIRLYGGSVVGKISSKLEGLSVRCVRDD